MNSNYPFIKKFEQLWNSRHKCVKWSKVKMSRLNIKNEPVWLKNIRLGTQGVPNLFVIMSQFPLDDNEMNHIDEHSENMHYTTVKLYQYF